MASDRFFSISRLSSSSFEVTRFYDLVISDPDTGEVWKPTATGQGFVKSKGGSTFTSYANGANVPGALNIEFDVVTYPFNTPQGASSIRICGVGINMISQAANLNDQNITLSAGMKKGLPLATPPDSVAKAGVIVQGTVFQAYGNWQGVNQSLDLIFNPAAAQADQNISFHWPAGTQLSTALKGTFQQAFAQYKMTAPKVTIASLIQDHDEDGGPYPTLSSFAGYIQERSQVLGVPTYGEDYSGVQITIIGNQLFAFDNQQKPPPIQLSFFDLIGQPTWIGVATVNFKTVLRSDITVGSRVKFPTQGILAPYVLTSQAAALPNVPARNKSVFQGTFDVIEVHNFCNFRQPDGDSFVTAYSAVATPT
jgi:hypothetical protein